MRNIGYLAYALGCWSLIACSNSKGVEGGGDGAGGAFNTFGGNNAGVGGHYVPSTSSTDPAGTGGADPLSSTCAQVNVPIQQLPPDIMIVMDRSMSMTDDINGKACAGGTMSGNGNCGVDSKWYQAITAVEAVVNATQGKVNWGMFYLGSEPTTCGANKTPVVPITTGDSYTPIAAALDSEAFTGQIGTPTAAVVNNAVTYLNTITEANPKYLLLATDGEPNCANGSVNITDAAGTVTAITKAKNAGYETFVVGIATATVAGATDALNQAAVAGGHPLDDPATRYYAVTNTDSLSTALNQIVTLATSCTIALSSIPTGQDWDIAISATNSSGDTVEVPMNGDNGYGYTDQTRTAIALVGTFCDGLKSGEYKDFNLVYTCKGHPFVF